MTEANRLFSMLTAHLPYPERQWRGTTGSGMHLVQCSEKTTACREEQSMSESLAAANKPYDLCWSMFVFELEEGSVSGALAAAQGPAELGCCILLLT
jgi:hypothetical protein